MNTLFSLKCDELPGALRSTFSPAVPSSPSQYYSYSSEPSELSSPSIIAYFFAKNSSSSFFCIEMASLLRASVSFFSSSRRRNSKRRRSLPLRVVFDEMLFTLSAVKSSLLAVCETTSLAFELHETGIRVQVSHNQLSSMTSTPTHFV